MTSWLRWHHGTVSDPKWRLIAHKAGANVHEVLALWCYILEEASQQTNRGVVPPIDYELASFVTGVTEDAIAAIEAAMMGRVMDDQRFLTGWNARQYVDETNAERQARYRKKSGKAKEKSNDSNALRNGSNALCPLRNGSNALRNAQNRTDTEQSITEHSRTEASEQAHSYAHEDNDEINPFIDPPAPAATPRAIPDTPVNIPARLMETYTEIVDTDGPKVAQRALKAGRRLFRSPTEKQLLETWKAAAQAQVLGESSDLWPDFRDSIKAEKAKAKNSGAIEADAGDLADLARWEARGVRVS